ncbi:MAG: flagellar biosynthesis protein FlhF [Verrucomicrobiota bacterium]|nr:flagellar biosynthesis protein FlhF [Verrucomicrobiota bacterium]
MSSPCYKFTVNNAHEAASVIRERLGEHARVLSVRTVEPTGLRGLWASPKIEVIAAVEAPAAVAVAPSPVGASLLATSDEVASPVDREPAAAAPRAVVQSPRRLITSLSPNARPELAPLLRRSGFSEAILSRLENAPVWASLREMPLHRALVETGRYLRRVAGTRRSGAPLSRAAFFGPAGTGRTTALCKWLGSEVSRRARLGHVVTAEFDQPVSRGALPVFCEALGVPLAHFPASTRPATPGGFVYFDLPALSLRDPAANVALADFLDREQITERVLVLNAAYGHDALRAGYARGRELGATHVVFTHLDELAQWGRLWDYLIDGGLEPLFLSTGSSLTGECDEEVFDALTRRTLPIVDDAAEPAADEDTEDAA